MLDALFGIPSIPTPETALLRRNLRTHIVDGTLFGFAMSFVSVNTIMPVYIHELGGGAVSIACVPVLWTLGVNFPQAFLLRFIFPGARAMPLVMRYGALYRLAFLGVGCFTIFAVPFLSRELAVAFALFLLCATAVAGSLGVPAWFQIYTKTTPVRFRGRLLAVRQILGSALGVVAGAIVSFLMTAIPTPTNFGVLFIIAFLVSMVSLWWLRKVEESADAGAALISTRSADVWRQAKSMLRTRKDLRNFLVADALILMAMTTAAFFAVYGLEQFNLPVSYAGSFTAILMGSMVLGNVAFGFMADALGHRLNMVLLALSTVAANVTALAATNELVYGLVFFFMACTISLQGISRMNLVAELSTESERPLVVALVNTLTAPTMLFGLLAGFMVRWFGFEIVFGIAAIFAIGASIWLQRRVPEPRRGTA